MWHGLLRWFRFGSGERSDWVLEPNANWHDFGGVAQGFNMLDPIKAPTGAAVEQTLGDRVTLIPNG